MVQEIRNIQRQSLANGEIVDLVNWVNASPGQTYFTPAGTVHAIGAGLVVCEIQQNSDITYRLYDYDRPRELHVEKSLAVADLFPHPGASVPVLTAEGSLLATGPYFETELIRFEGSKHCTADGERFHLLIFTRGSGLIDGQPFQQGDCWLIASDCADYVVTASQSVEMLRTFVPRLIE